MTATVVALGDLARSPRTMYHARALAGEQVHVDLVGYLETPQPPSVVRHERITVHALPAYDGPARGGAQWTTAAASRRGLRLASALGRLLLRRLPRADVILVQNPPGVPTLLVAWSAARARGSRFVIDWHNVTSAMLASRLTPRHPLVRATACYEGWFGRLADANLFVSSAMRDALHRRWGLRGEVFRDRPALAGPPLRPGERAEIRRALASRLDLAWSDGFGLAVSPTSWTADENFEVLLDAVRACDEDAARIVGVGGTFPPVLVLVTGRGPLREHYEARLAARRPCRFHVRTLWLEADEYPRVLAAADVGISLHTSTSALDLPMKVMDLLGAGVPVFAFDYGPCLAEAVHAGEDGVLFSSSAGLAAWLLDAFRRYPVETRLLDRLRAGTARSPRLDWGEAWRREARPVILPGLLPTRP